MIQHLIPHLAAIFRTLRARAGLLLLVSLIAASQVGASQLASLLVREAKLPAFFLMWFSTAWNLVFALPLLLTRDRSWRCHWKGGGLSLALVGCPFYLLWAGANTLYTQGLEYLSPPLVTALFSTTPAVVALLSVPLLHRSLTLLTVLASVVAAVGVTLVAQPWRSRHSHTATQLHDDAADGPVAKLLGVFAVLAAAACAATYKVCFRRVFGDAPAAFVLLILTIIGGWAVSLGTVFLYVLDGASLSQGKISLTPMAWALLCAKSVLDLAFNFLIAYGLALTHPLFVSVGTLLSTPINVLFEFCVKNKVPTVAGGAGMALIVSSFGLIIFDDATRGSTKLDADTRLISRETSTTVAEAGSEATRSRPVGDHDEGTHPG